jgi:choline dehydrogenase-like flavoprotein
MGAPDDPRAVVDPLGRVIGVDGLYVADASIFPTVPRANTNLPVIAAAERVAELLSLPPPAGDRRSGSSRSPAAPPSQAG